MKPTTWVVILFLLLAAAIYVFKSLRDLPVDTLDEAGAVLEKTGVVIDKASQALKEIAAAFNQGSVTTSFISYATSLNANHYLQFATLRQNEVFTRRMKRDRLGYSAPGRGGRGARTGSVPTTLISAPSGEFVLKDNVIYVPRSADSGQRAGGGRIGDHLRGQEGQCIPKDRSTEGRAEEIHYADGAATGQRNVPWCVKLDAGKSPILWRSGWLGRSWTGKYRFEGLFRKRGPAGGFPIVLKRAD